MLTTPIWLQAGEYSAREDRQILAALFTEGVIDRVGGDLAVTPRAAGANMSVDVAPGRAVVDGDDQADQGAYLCESTGTENLVVGAPPGANARIDLVVARVRDTNAGGPAGDDWLLEVIAGATDAAPVAPAVPDSALVLAEILVMSSDASVTAGMITDRRPQADVGGADFADGSAAQPSIVFTDDDDTGLYRPGDNAVAVALGGTKVLEVAGDGQLGALSGSQAAPTYAFDDHPGSGMWADGEVVTFSTGGNGVLKLETAAVDPFDDNTISLGSSSRRFTELWAVDSTINTSDVAAKRNVAAIRDDDAVARVRAVARAAINFRWPARARTHAGFDAEAVGAVHGDASAAYIDPAVTGAKGPKGLRVAELVPDLYVALGQALDRIDHLERTLSQRPAS